MDILIVMCLGVLVGNRIFPRKGKKLNEYLQLLCTLLLIFSMGVMLGSKENFFQELASLGITSFLFFLVPTVLSIFAVYFLTKRFLEKKHAKSEEMAGSMDVEEGV